MSDQVVHRSSPSNESSETSRPLPLSDPTVEQLSPADPSNTELFDLYEEVVQRRSGTRDAEIFEKIRQWTFSDFTLPAHEFAGITLTELLAWQKRNRINLSAGHIRPEHIDLERGHHWGQIRMASAANRLHSTIGPPSADEVKLAWSKAD